MSNCISHVGRYDDLDNPLDDEGSLYLPGERECGHRDCVNVWHIKGMEANALFMMEAQRKSHKRLRANNEAAAGTNWQIIYDEVVKIGRTPKIEGVSMCQLPFCGKPHKARNLCNNHFHMFRRQSPESLKRIKRHKPASFEIVPPPIFKRKDVDRPKECLFENCSKPVISRALCGNHYHIYLSMVKKQKISNERPKYTLDDFAHLSELPLRLNKKLNAECSIRDCAEPTSVKTLCENHYRTYLKLIRAAKKENK